MNDGSPALTGLSAVKLALMARSARAQSGAALLADPIAVVGMGCRFPGGADSPEKFWRVLSEGVDTVSEVPADRWDADVWFDMDPSVAGKSITKHAAFLERIDEFDAAYFGIIAREAERMDPQQRLLLEVAVDALDDAGLSRDRLRGARAGVFIASYHNDYAGLQYADPDAIDARTLTGTLHSVLANRLSYTLDLRGPSLSLDTACSSSLVAIHLACQSLRVGESDVAIAGGVSLIVTPDLMVSMSKVGFMAPDGRCKTFDAKANGFGRGEGCGIVVLKRLSDAIADGDRVLAVVRATSVNQDGHSTVLAAPNGVAQRALIADALASAQLPPERIGFFEAHGTGTMLGDPIEVEAIAATVGVPHPSAGPCWLGAAKANIGHLEASAGVAGLIKTVLALRHEAIPPQVHFNSLNPHISLAGTRLAVPTTLEPWPAGPSPRCAGVSSFGVGGTNAHAIIEEAPRLSPADDASRTAGLSRLFALSAQSPDALRTLVEQWVEFLPQTPAHVHDLAFTAGARRSHLDYRLAVVATTKDALRSNLSAFLSGESRPGLAGSSQRAGERPRLALVFSGQGPQWFAMGRELLETEPVFRDAFAACDAAFAPPAGWSLLQELAATEATSRLNETEVAQPALVAIQISLAALWAAWGIRPDGVVGHSVGEIAALHVAGVLSLADAMRVAWQRGRVMQAATGLGRMAAVAITADEAEHLVRPFGDRLSVGAYNSPRSVVFSGEQRALETVLTELAQRGVSHRMLPVQYAFHSAQMAPFQRTLADALADLVTSAPVLPVYSTVTGVADTRQRFDAAYFGRNVREPVRLDAAISAMANDGYTAFLEISPHPVLGGSITESLEARTHRASVFGSLRRGRPERETMLHAAAALYAIGMTPEWDELNGGPGEVVDLPRYPWQRKRYWLAPPKRPAPGTLPRSASGNPLLGRRVATAGVGPRIFESSWVPGGADGIHHHRIGGRVALPVAAMLEMFRGAEPASSIESLSVLRPLFLPDAGDEPKTWQVVATRGSERTSLELYEHLDGHSRGESLEDDWRLIATASASPGRTPAAEIAPRDGAGKTIAPDAFYARLATLGAEFGPAFRSIETIEHGDGWARGRLTLAPDVQADEHRFGIHPALLDGALQLCSVAAPPGPDGERPELLLVPLGVRGFELHRLPPRDLWAQVRVENNGTNSLVADVRLHDDEGNLVGTLTGVRFAKTDATTFIAGADADPWLYQIGWRELAAAPNAGATAAGSWLVFTDRTGVGDAVCTALELAGATCHRVCAGDSLVQSGARACTVDPADPAHIATVLESWRDAGTTRGIVHLWALDTTPFDGASLDDAAETLDHDALNAVGSVLHLAQALAGAGNVSDPLWLVTRGAQAAPGAAPVSSPSGAGLWGFAGAVMAEHSERSIRLIDIDPAPTFDTRRLVHELLSTGPLVVRVALRENRRLAPRLERYRHRAQSTALHVEVAAAGTLDGLRIMATAGRAPRPDEVRVAVRACGLNFRDVLMALGAYPGATLPLGAECAGIVTHVGSAVTDFAVGDAVCGYAKASMGGDVTVPARFLTKMPSALSFNEAAAVPVAFLTAHYAFEDIARLERGQRVLIHAAAGGVGSAAVQLAQRRGAEVFATAGSPEKREWLRSLGVPHVLDSRTLNFVEEVRRATAGKGVHVVLNSLAGEFIPAGISTVARGGWFVEMGKRDIWTNEAVAKARPDIQYRAFDLADEAERDVGLLRRLFAGIVAGFADGSLRAPPVTVFPLAEARNAFRFMAQAKHIGKIVLSTGGSRENIVRDSATYWVTGGLGALGLETARWLVASGAKHLALTGRRPPSDDSAAVIRELERAGAVVRVLVADASDRAQMQGVIDEIGRSMPPLRGVVHAAGTVDDGAMVLQTWDRCLGVIRGKAHGARILHDMTANIPLDLFVLYSASGTILGAPGQSAYAAANAELDALAHARQASGLPALSIAWGAWRDAGMAADAAGVARGAWSARGLGTIAANDGFARLAVLLRDGVAHAAALPIDWTTFLATLPAGVDRDFFAGVAAGRAQGPAAPDMPPDTGIAGQLMARRPAQRRAALMNVLSERTLHVLGLDAGTPIDPTVPLRDLGLDSLMSVELSNVLARTVRQPLSATLLFDFPTLEALAAHIAGVLKLDEDAAPAASAADGARAAIAELSDEEAEALLLAELDVKPGHVRHG